LIILDGGVGEGKTTLLCHILNYINYKHDLPPIDYDGDQLGLGGVEFLKKLRGCYEKKFPCIGYDEAGDFNRRSSLTSFNAMLNRTFETFRAFKCIIVIALPNFAVLDQQLFDNRIPRLLIHLKTRSNNYGNFTAYDLQSMEWLKFHMSKLPIKAYAWSKVFPNFHGHFLNLEPEESKKLDQVSTKNKIKILANSEVKIEGLLSIPDIATKLGVTVQTVQLCIKNFKIKEVKKVSRVRYFNKEIVDTLADKLETINTSDLTGYRRKSERD
jgi:hypothetical protein